MLAIDETGPVEDGDASHERTEALRSEVEAIIRRHASSHDGYRTPVPGLQVARLTAPLPPTAHVSEASVCVCVRGARALTVGDVVMEQGETEYLLTTVGLPTVVAIPSASPERPYTALRVDLDLDLARQVMAEIDLGCAGPAAPAARSAFAEVDAAFLDAVARLVRLIEAPWDIPFLGGLLQREILYRLLRGPGGARIRQTVRTNSQGHRVARAAEWLRANFRKRLRVEDLAGIAGMGVSTLHRHFHDLTGMSPVHYQKHLRLHEARRLMLDEDADVHSTALAVGYESATQFIREYRRLFGQPPLRSIRALRSAGGSHPVL